MRVCTVCTSQFPDDVSYCPHDGIRIAPVTDPLIGATLLGQFRVIAKLGRGAMGSVYKAWQPSMERAVAVKILHRNMVRDAAIRSRFAREARSVAHLSHPNIVTVHVVGETDDARPFLVMEMVDGEQLDAVLERGPLPAERAVRIARQIASALADAHAGGIVHRDLKPANIMLVQRRRCADFVKVLDFGIAKVIDANLLHPGESHLTREGTIFGTPHYLSPEQAAGGDVDHRSDIYSLGVMLYEMVTGQRPFEGSQVPVMVAHMTRPVPPVAERAPHTDPALARVIMRCLEKRPEARFPSAETLADALDALDAAAPPPWASLGVARAARSEATRSSEQGFGAARPDTMSHSHPAISIDAFGNTVPVWAREPFDLGDEPAAPRGGRSWLAGLAVALILAGVAITVARSHLLAGPVASRPVPAAAIAGRPSSRPDSAPAAAIALPPRRLEIVADGGYAMRVAMPERFVVGIDYEISLDVWDPAGEPLGTSEIIIILIKPGELERAHAAGATEVAGSYRFGARFDDPGRYVIRVHPPGGDASLQLHLDVAAGADG